MKKNDLLFLAGVILFFSPFFFVQPVFDWYNSFNTEHGVLMSFLKFAILATMGEAIGLRIRAGEYNRPGFGIIPRAIVWGFLGMAIKLAFVVFAVGVPVFVKKFIVSDLPADILKQDFSALKLLTAFSISVCLNCIFAPVMMTAHKITDEHITRTGGTIAGLFTPIAIGDIFAKINWSVMWNFVFKKTIPLFWIPAHTITFLLPEAYQILFAALLGIVLGVLLAVASLMGKKQAPAPAAPAN